MRTMAQKRAGFALQKVLNIHSDKKDFEKFSAGIPSMILQNGFGQTLAFLLSKGTDKEGKIKQHDKHIEIFDIIKEWLSYQKEDVKNNFVKEQGRTKMIDELMKMKVHEYQAAHNEALALLEWIKRFASADLS